MRRRGQSIVLVCLLFCVSAARAEETKPRFLPEDWIVTYEPLTPTSWGVEWGLNNFLLPYRILQRGKQTLESRYTNNWQFSSDHPRIGGILMRTFVGTGAEFGLFMGLQNLHHQMGHDAAAREFARQWNLGDVPTRFGQTLPSLFPGGGPLAQVERQTGGGADAQTQYMVQPMQEELQFAYAAGQNVLERDQSNRDEVQDFLMYRLRHLSDWFDEKGTVDQGFSDFIAGSNSTPQQQQLYGGSNNGFSTDYTDYIISLNRRRYGVTNINDYKVTMNDLGRSHLIQMFDPLFLVSAWSYGKDYIVHGKNQVSVPMLHVSDEVSYLPSLRVFFSPFGIEYYQDNYLRFHGSLTNVFWTMGDNSYQKRYGGGVDIQNVVWQRVRIGVYGMVDRQPFLNRVTDMSSLSAGEFNQGHIGVNGGASLKILLRRFPGEDQEGLFVYTRVGVKNTSWFPGEYLAGGPYLQVGLGLRL